MKMCIRDRSSGDCSCATHYLYTEATQGDELKLFIFIKQCIGHYVGRGKKEVDTEQLAQDAQDWAVIIGSNGPRGGKEEY